MILARLEPAVQGLRRVHIKRRCCHMATITISRQFGAGGRTLGRELARRLGYRCVDEVMVRDVAKEINVSPGQVRGFEKEGGANLMKFIDKLVSTDYIGRLISPKYGTLDEKKYVDTVRSIIQELHKQGNVIIIGRGSQYILNDSDDAYHILLVRELEDRFRFIAEKYEMKEAEAAKVVSRADKNRVGFLKFFSESRSHDNPLFYHLALNMNRMSLDKAADLVIDLVSQ